MEVPAVQKRPIAKDLVYSNARKLITKPQVPPPGLSLVKNSPTLDKSLQGIVTECFYGWKDSENDVDMGSGSRNGPIFMFFLGIEGKEQVAEMDYISYKNVLYVSSNMETLADKIQQVACTSNKQCYQISSHFGILDPLGGGSYPLNYMVVIDSDWKIRCQLPIRMNPKIHGNHEKFGVSFNELAAVVDQYMMYFS